MEYLRSALRYSLAEPYIWLFYCFFQPNRFERDIDVSGLKTTDSVKRLVAMSRLALPMFSYCYPLALLVRMYLNSMFPGTTSSCYLIAVQCVEQPDIVSIFLTTASTTALSLAIGIFIGSSCGLCLGITLGSSLGIALGAAQGIAGAITLGIVAGLIEGTILGTIDNRIAFIAWCITLTIVFTVIGNIASGIAGGLTVTVILSLARGISNSSNETTWLRLSASIIIGCIAGGLILFMEGSITWFITKDIQWFVEAESTSIYGVIAFVVSYSFGYSRLLLYPVSSLSSLQCYHISNRNPTKVFNNLHASSLYWDETTFLPLPHLKYTLTLAAAQYINTEQFLKEIEFIVTKRPQQYGAVWAATSEFILRDLEGCSLLEHIVDVAERLTKIFPSESGTTDPQWSSVFTCLQDMSRDITSYNNQVSWQARRNTLEDMQTNLGKVHTQLRDINLNKRVSAVITTLQTIVQQEQKKLDRLLGKTGQLINPYNPGPILESGDSLFVGRSDLGRQLEDVLSKGQRHPTFFLYGERRMGKSCTLKQLPHLLGARYLPITYDLQRPGILSSTAAFLGNVAEEIYEVIVSRGMQITKMERERLHEAEQKSQASAYYLFDEWLKAVEHHLEQEDRVLLLAFDEFEKLEEAQQHRYLDLRLMMDWLRNIIQHRPRLALLFCGIHTIGEMGTNWAGYFVNVQTLKVSFLKPHEARKLIAHPVSDFPGEEIFGEAVVEEILRVTNCHPFLIQAVCDRLITHLNEEKRGKADMQDVTVAVQMVLENWWAYFRDLWERTDHNQRQCLFALLNSKTGTVDSIEKESELSKIVVYHTMQKLCKRDLVMTEQNIYRISTPIFCEWIEHNTYAADISL